MKRDLKKTVDIRTFEGKNATMVVLSYPLFKTDRMTCLEPEDRTKALKVSKSVFQKKLMRMKFQFHQKVKHRK